MRHVNSQGKTQRVTKSEDGEFFIGNTQERAEGKMCHYTQTLRSRSINPYSNEGDEWSDYAHTSDDL